MVTSAQDSKPGWIIAYVLHHLHVTDSSDFTQAFVWLESEFCFLIQFDIILKKGLLFLSS